MYTYIYTFSALFLPSSSDTPILAWIDIAYQEEENDMMLGRKLTSNASDCARSTITFLAI